MRDAQRDPLTKAETMIKTRKPLNTKNAELRCAMDALRAERNERIFDEVYDREAIAAISDKIEVLKRELYAGNQAAIDQMNANGDWRE